MSGPVLDLDPQGTTPDHRPGGDTRPAPPFLEGAAASMRSVFDDNNYVLTQRLEDAYAPAFAALRERGVPAAALRPDYLRQAIDLHPTPRTSSVRFDFDKIWGEVERQRRRDPAAFAELPRTRDEFETRILTRGGADDRDRETAGRAGILAQLAGGAVGSFADPANVASLALPGAGAAASLTRKLLVDALTNAAVEAAQAPQVARARKARGEEITAEEIALNIGSAAVFGAGFRGGIEAGAAGKRALGDAIDAKFPDRALARELRRMVPENLRTPEQEAALFIVERQADIDEASPFVRTYEGLDAHRARLDAAMEAIEEGRVVRDSELAEAGRPTPRIEPGVLEDRVITPAADFASVKALIRGPESGGNDRATNALGSSASGRYQFIQSTFVRLYDREFGGGGGAAWATRRFDAGIQERLMDRLLADNAAQLARAGVPADAGNLYLAHFAGAAKAVELARAPRNAPVSGFFSPAAIAQNPGYLGGGKTVGEALAVIRGKVGGGEPGAVLPSLADLGDDSPLVRPEALDAVRPTVVLNGGSVAMTPIAARDIGVDAGLMQFKSGGDGEGVTERLRGVEQWNPMAAGTVTVWEAADGRRLIADGHQRLGLARRLEAGGHEPIQLNAFVLREADGVSAESARVITAMTNIGQGTGSASDAAKVFRAVGLDSDQVKRALPPRSALVRDGKSLARLSDEAFGAVVNEVIPESHGAAIGALVDDPGLHAGMVRVLYEAAPANRGEAEAVVRQALDAGFVREVQDSLFGAELRQVGLFAQRARLLGKALGELKKMKGAFQVAARNADALDAAGNRIDVAASEAAADGNARALALVDALALRKGNAVNDLLNEAARRIGDGEPQARVLRDFVAGVRALDLEGAWNDAAGRDGGAGGAAGGSGQLREPDGPFRGDEPEPGEQLSPVELDAAAAARPWSDHSEPALFADPDPKWSEPDGDGAAQAAESLWHDLDAEVSADRGPSTLADVERVAAAHGVTLTADDFPDYIALHNLERPRAAAKGGGATVMRALTAFSDRIGKPIELVVMGPGGGNLKLENFYRQFGFETNGRVARAGEPHMERAPRAIATSDASTAARQAQEAALRASSPLRGENVSGEAQDGAMGLALFDAANEPEFAGLTIDIGDGRGELPIGEMRAELDADRAALEALKGCL